MEPYNRYFLIGLLPNPSLLIGEGATILLKLSCRGYSLTTASPQNKSLERK